MSPSNISATDPQCACSCGCTNRTPPTPLSRTLSRPFPTHCLPCATHCTPTARDLITDQWTHPAHRHQWSRQWATRVPAMYKNATLDEAVTNDIIKTTTGQSPQGVILTGPIGSGKTHRAYGILNTLVHNGYTHPDNIIAGRESTLLADSVYGAWNTRDQARRNITNPKLAAAFIDDTGHAAWKSQEERWSVWTDLTDRILSNNGYLIITTNLSSEQLQEWVGPPALSRIRALTRGTAAIINDRNYRADLFSGNPT